jgi:hypothetical protein
MLKSSAINFSQDTRITGACQAGKNFRSFQIICVQKAKTPPAQYRKEQVAFLSYALVCEKSKIRMLQSSFCFLRTPVLIAAWRRPLRRRD